MSVNQKKVSSKKRKTSKTQKKLVIVESPSKAKTIGKFLGATYKVIASVGHVRDLPKSRLGIDVENNFEPQYISIRGKGDVIKALKKEAKNAKAIYLATDPDREGEAISWHLAYLLGIDELSKCRVEFNEITKEAVKKAVAEPRSIDRNMVDAQQARRVLDRLVGYNISPLLWRKIRTGLSAGRVQSAALKMICDRENEIREFKPEEYWTLQCNISHKPSFVCKLYKDDLNNKDEAEKVKADIEKSILRVKGIKSKEGSRSPSAPFTTSTLQQEASNKLNFRTQKTMQVAQQLYEGIDIKGLGTLGLITYIRTDSVRLSKSSQDMAKKYIIENMGEEYYQNREYKNKKKDIQDAHEAIRPSDVNLSPDEIKASLTVDQYKLYNLIWSRFLASQMTNALYDGVTVLIDAGGYELKVVGRVQTFDGFLRVYKYSVVKDDKIPRLEEGEILDLEKVEIEQKFTQPPSRYSEASLVAALEEDGIGRPSTYAPIVGTLVQRRYIKREKKNLISTELGEMVNDMMVEYFTHIVDADFTSKMEDHLDSIEEGNTFWKDIIQDFYGEFEKELKDADEKIEKIEPVKEEPRLAGEDCEKCGAPMLIKNGRYGEFLACSNFPNCNNTKPILKPIGVNCPKCDGEILEKRSRRGKIFYGCSKYPECDTAFFNKPLEERCPSCGSILTIKSTKRFEGVVCTNEECDYKEMRDLKVLEEKNEE